MKVWKLSNVTACKMWLQRREGEMQLTDRHTAFCHSEPTGGRLGTCGSHGVDSPTTLQLDTRMDATEENNMEDMKMDIQTNQTIDKDFLATSDDANQHLSIGDGPSSSCRKVWVRSRPKLQSTKSFPPYSQCIGGLGDNRELDCEINCESNFYQLPFRHETVRSDGHADIPRTERNDVVLTPRCTREEVKFKWRMMRLGGSYEVDPDGWERGRWSGKRRVGETGQEPCERDDKTGEEGTNSEWKHCRSKNTSLETARRETGDEQRSGSVSATEGVRVGSEEAAAAKDEEAAGLTSGRRGSTAHGQPSPHPILSKLLHSSSSTSSSNLSSPDSDEVFSEEEDASKKRKTFRKSRSWKPYLTMVHWSLRRQSSWVQLGGHQGMCVPLNSYGRDCDRVLALRNCKRRNGELLKKKRSLILNQHFPFSECVET
ncbi:uncharacterized protein LOC114864698 [Betta splendens]|uniref:Uncharacterized protein LOC114864698 n=1 Tax=Betta splendens TaxID=158456 RepID=A0A9W2Y346_BETSP|nr:uncharacterized protein LOC114864698 [Betta splendens]